MTADDFAALPIEFGSRPFTALDVVALIDPPADPDTPVTPKHAEVRRALQRIGNALARRVGETVVAPTGLHVRLVKAGTAHASRQLWRFEPAPTPADPDEDLL